MNNFSIVRADVYMLSREPLRLCRFLLQECESRSNIHVHNPALATLSPKPVVVPTTTVHIQYRDSDKSIDVTCENIIVTSGPWTTSVLSTLFPHLAPSAIPRIMALSGHSILLRSKNWPEAGISDPPCHAVFINDPSSKHSPEAISRLGGEIYIAGVNDADTPLPESPGSSAPLDHECVELLTEIGKKLCGDVDVEVSRSAICFRPITSDGNPFIGRVGVEREGLNVWVGAGHGPWGISLSLGTGMVLSELVLGLRTSVDIDKLAPQYSK